MFGCRSALLVGLALGLSGCSSSSAEPTPTGATCPPASASTYENFGQAFMEAYCVRCHSSDLHGSERQGAPLYHDFDTLLGTVVVSEHVDWYAGAGPDSVNELMPPDGAKPTIEERTELSEWLVCEVERFNARPDAGVAVDAGT